VIDDAFEWGSEWQSAFPIRSAREAAGAICESWRILAARPRPGFNSKLREPVLTRALKAHVENVTARKHGLLGMWATESVINTIDPDTAEITEERRYDIIYGWNDEHQSMQMVFEFKKLDGKTKDRREYLGANGLGRFVSGIYSRGQPLAAMVGILLDRFDVVVPPIHRSLGEQKTIDSLGICVREDGPAIRRPSEIFSDADFDTEHLRSAELAPQSGSIHVAHIFLPFV
jgi:hypothetical protein|tara:strand:- start:2916 stop:3605 length:690 start_codon:yes stop_codon:yes gene_type:complete